MYLDSLSPASPTQGPLGPARRFDWRTPQALFDKLDAEFGFALDACADMPLKRDLRFFGPIMDGLMKDWGPGPVFLNPPYGKEIAAWMERAVLHQQMGVMTVCLVPARLDVRWWHELVMPFAAEVRCIRSRLKFDDGDANAPFSSVVIVYDPERSGPPCLSIQR